MVLVDYYIKGLMVDKIDKLKEPDTKEWLVQPEQIIEAIEANNGFMTQAAKGLNISRATLYNYINASSSLQEAITQAKESLIDFAESILKKNIEAGKETSLIYFMNCKGRHRGYGNFKQIEIIDKDTKPEKLDPAFL
jgi:hypothetical protein